MDDRYRSVSSGRYVRPDRIKLDRPYLGALSISHQCSSACCPQFSERIYLLPSKRTALTNNK